MVVRTHMVSADAPVVGSIDVTEAGEEYIIADISVDDAWLSMAADEAPTLPSMR